MLLTVVTYHIGAGDAGQFYEEIMHRSIRDDTRREPGNISYDFYLSPECAEDILLVEKWENPEALAVHKQSKAFFKLQDIKAAFQVSVDGRVYEV